MKITRRLSAVALFAAVVGAALDPARPPSRSIRAASGSAWCRSRGLRRRRAFVGFESADQGVKVLLTELPAAAFGEVEAAFKATPEGAGGVKPQNMETAAGKAYYTVETAQGRHRRRCGAIR